MLIFWAYHVTIVNDANITEVKVEQVNAPMVPFYNQSDSLIMLQQFLVI